MIEKSHRPEIWDLHDDLIDVLICLGFVTFQPVDHWMFDGSYNLAHYLGPRLYFKTKESAIDFFNADIKPRSSGHFATKIIQIKEMLEVRFD
jgi:hypothetical protein